MGLGGVIGKMAKGAAVGTVEPVEPTLSSQASVLAPQAVGGAISSLVKNAPSLGPAILSPGHVVSPTLASRYGIDPALTNLLFAPARQEQDILNKFPGLTVSSGYRDPSHNAQVGGVPGSLHTQGTAADFTGPEDLMAQAAAYAQTLPGIDEAMVHDAGSGRHLHAGFKRDSHQVPGDNPSGLTHDHGGDTHTHVDPSLTFYTPESQEKILESVGFSPEAAKIMAAIGMAESGGDPTARANTQWEDSRGLYQINLNAHPQYKSVDLSDPYENAKAAYEVSNGGTNFGPWTMFTNGKYQDYLDPDYKPEQTTTKRTDSGSENTSSLLTPAMRAYAEMQGLPGTGAAGLIQSLGRQSSLTSLFSDANRQGLDQNQLMSALTGQDDSNLLSSLQQLYSFLDNPTGTR